MKRIITPLLLSILLLLPAQARVFVVTNANEEGEGSLREAILQANATEARDTICFEGVKKIEIRAIRLYPITADITIDGGEGVTIEARDGTWSRPPIFSINQVSSFTLKGLTLIGGYDVYGGGAIHCEADWRSMPNASPKRGRVQITDCVFLNNRASRYPGGGAIYMMVDAFPDSFEEVIIRNCEFRGNSSEFGGAILLTSGYIDTSMPYLIQNCLFKDNYGAIHILSSQSASIDNCVFSENRSRTFFTEKSINDGSPTRFSNCIFTDHTLENSDGMILGDYLYFENCLFTNNTITQGGIFNSSYLEIVNSTIVGNQSEDHVILAQEMVHGAIIHSTIVGNSSPYLPIETTRGPSTLLVCNSLITGNKVTKPGLEYADIGLASTHYNDNGMKINATLQMYGSIYGKVWADLVDIRTSKQNRYMAEIFEDPSLALTEEGVLRIKQGGLADGTARLVGKREKHYDMLMPYQSWYFKEFDTWRRFDGKTAPAEEIKPLITDQLGNERPEGSISIGAWQYSNNTDIPQIKEDIDAGLLIYNISPGTLMVSVTDETARGKRVDVYSLSGVLIHQQPVQSGTMTIQLPAGIYLVKVGDETRKVVVN